MSHVCTPGVPVHDRVPLALAHGARRAALDCADRPASQRVAHARRRHHRRALVVGVLQARDPLHSRCVRLSLQCPGYSVVPTVPQATAGHGPHAVHWVLCGTHSTTCYRGPRASPAGPTCLVERARFPSLSRRSPFRVAAATIGAQHCCAYRNGIWISCVTKNRSNIIDLIAIIPFFISTFSDTDLGKQAPPPPRTEVTSLMSVIHAASASARQHQRRAGDAARAHVPSVQARKVRGGSTRSRSRTLHARAHTGMPMACACSAV